MADIEDDIPEGDDLFDVDAVGVEEKEEKEPEPLFRIYKGSRIAVSKSMGKTWQQRRDAAIAAYDAIYEAWNQSFAYYNNNQNKALDTPRGTFRRGDSTENIVYSNLNVMLPAVYSKDPDITCNTNDEGDQKFVKCLQAVINAFIKRRSALNGKPKFKRAVGLGLLTNMGVLKLDWTKKDDSIEMANSQLIEITTKLANAKTTQEIETFMGELAALEGSMEIFSKSGPKLTNVLPHNLIVDPYAEDMDGMDSNWMMEDSFIQTDFLRARYTQPCIENSDDPNNRVLVFKPSHKASMNNSGTRDDGLGVVLNALDAGDVTEYQNEEREGYTSLYYTRCVTVWDKTTRRVYLFQYDDWTWPLWVWEDPLKLSRFFPYFIIAFGMSTGGTVSVGETAYYLDQQDEINDINRQVARIRRSVFDFFFYNSDVTNKDEVEKFINAIRGEGTGGKAEHILGIRAGENKISDLVQAFVPPQLQYEALFNKEPTINAINRISNTSDALRGTQYKTNTNESAVESYQDAARMAVGAKIDVVEDCISDLANALAELAIQNMTKEDVEGLVGKELANSWEEIELEDYLNNYNMEVVAGTTEKKNSTFKKKEAIQVAQAIGQFASAAPVTSMKIMLKVLEQAFTEVVITPEDWANMDKEMQQQAQRGDSTGGASAAGAGGGGGLEEQLMNLPPEIKSQVEQMAQQGAPPEQIKQFLMEQLQQGGGAPPAASPQPAPQPQPQAA